MEDIGISRGFRSSRSAFKWLQGCSREFRVHPRGLTGVSRDIRRVSKSFRESQWGFRSVLRVLGASMRFQRRSMVLHVRARSFQGLSRTYQGNVESFQLVIRLAWNN